MSCKSLQILAHTYLVKLDWLELSNFSLAFLVSRMTVSIKTLEATPAPSLSGFNST